MTGSTLAICVKLCRSLSLFSSFAHQTARESAEITRPRGIRRSVVVITGKCHYPANKPPPLFCSMLTCTKRGGRNCGILRCVVNYLPWVVHKFSRDLLHYIPYSRKFSYGTNFHIFCMQVLHARIKTTKLVPLNFHINFDLSTHSDYQIQAASVLPNY